MWLWREKWPGKKDTDRNDIGVDLVTEQVDGSLAAIQCKFRHEQKVPTQEVDKFLATASRPEFAAGVIMTNGEGFSGHGQKKITDARCDVFDMNTMCGWEVDWKELAEQTRAVTGDTPPRTGRATRFDTEKGLVLLGRAVTAVVIAVVAAFAVTALAPASWSVTVIAFVAALVGSVATLAFVYWTSGYG